MRVLVGHRARVVIAMVLAISIVVFIQVVDLLGPSGPLSNLPGFRSRNITFNIWSTPVYSTTFEYWKSSSPREHCFSAFASPADLEQGKAYTSLSPFLISFMFLLTCPGRMSDASIATIHLATVLPGFLALFALIVWHCYPQRTTNRTTAEYTLLLILASLGTTTVLSLPSYWIGGLRLDVRASTQMLPILLACWIGVREYEGKPPDRATYWGMLLVALLTPHYTPIFVLVAFVLWAVAEKEENTGARGFRTVWLIRLGYVLALGTFSLVVPTILAKLGGFQPIGSSFLYRSGLDGSTQYFSSIYQAIFSPYQANSRPWCLWPPVFFAGLIMVFIAYFEGRKAAERMMRQAVLSTIPYFFLAITFPQAVSIHPYGYDMLLVVPSLFCAVFWMSRPSCCEVLLQRRVLLLATVLGWATLLMTNLLDTARMFK